MIYSPAGSQRIIWWFSWRSRSLFLRSRIVSGGGACKNHTYAYNFVKKVTLPCSWLRMLVLCPLCLLHDRCPVAFFQIHRLPHYSLLEEKGIMPFSWRPLERKSLSITMTSIWKTRGHTACKSESSESELATSSAQDRIRLLSSSLWALRLRGGEPETAVTGDVSDASDVDSL